METNTWRNDGGVLSADGSDRVLQIVDSINGEQFINNSSACGLCSNNSTVSRCSSRGRFISTFPIESRQDSLRAFHRRGSYSLPRDLGNQMLKSISISRELVHHILGEVDSSIVAQIGDGGDRTIVDGQKVDSEIENLEIPIDNAIIIENGFKRLSNQYAENMTSPVYLLEEDSFHDVYNDLTLHTTEKETQRKDKQDRLLQRLDYISHFIHLAVFGILGVLTRYALEKLFGADLLALTGDDSPLYLDLPSNMLGSFLMGWLGVVFKADLLNVSEHLTIGLTTGYMGSVTTFSGWNQKMLNLSSKGHWTFAVAGIVLGMLIVNECVNIGVESAQWLRTCLLKWSSQETKTKIQSMILEIFKRRHMMVIIFMLVIWLSLWGLSGTLAKKKLESLTNGAVLWLGCLVGPFGVWTRWYLARLNGQGLGKKGALKWLPIGTFLANFTAACFMAALSTITKAVNTERCTLIISGIQFGFLGCMSTVSTLVAEVYAMRQSGHPGRALSYAILTIFSSFAAGTLLYSLPVWSKHYN